MRPTGAPVIQRAPAQLPLPVSGARGHQAWHALSVADVERTLGTTEFGLAEGEAARRLAIYGRNEIEGERLVPWWTLVMRQFRDPLIYILLLAAGVTLVLRDFADSGVILAVVVLNAIIGFVQELRARQAMLALARLSAPHAEVVHDGASQRIDSRDLVPGDVVLLASGSRVPADLRLLRIRDLEVDESALTGESLAVRKSVEPIAAEILVPGDQVNMAFAGTTVTRGRARADGAGDGDRPNRDGDARGRGDGDAAPAPSRAVRQAGRSDRRRAVGARHRRWRRAGDGSSRRLSHRRRRRRVGDPGRTPGRADRDARHRRPPHGEAAMASGELDKWRNRRSGRLLG